MGMKKKIRSIEFRGKKKCQRDSEYSKRKMRNND